MKFTMNQQEIEAAIAAYVSANFAGTMTSAEFVMGRKNSAGLIANVDIQLGNAPAVTKPEEPAEEPAKKVEAKETKPAKKKKRSSKKTASKKTPEPDALDDDDDDDAAFGDPDADDDTGDDPGDDYDPMAPDDPDEDPDDDDDDDSLFGSDADLD